MTAHNANMTSVAVEGTARASAISGKAHVYCTAALGIRSVGSPKSMNFIAWK